MYWILVIAVAVLLGMPSAAHAYLEPGTASTILQLILAALVGTAAICKLYWQRLRAFAARVLGRPVPGDQERSESPEPESLPASKTES